MSPIARLGLLAWPCVLPLPQEPPHPLVPSPPAPSPVAAVEDVARHLVAAAYQDTPHVFRRITDFEELGARTVDEGAAARGRLESLLARLDPWRGVSDAIAGGGDFTFLRAWEEGGAVLGLFRQTVLLEFDYHVYRFEPDPDGALRIVDAHLFSRGEFLSDTLRRALARTAASLTAVEDLEDHVRAGDVERGLAALAELPPLLRRDPDVLRLRAALTGGTSAEAWTEAIAAVEEELPRATTAIHLRLVHGVAHDGPEVLEEALARLEAHTRDEAFAEYFRGNLDRRVERFEPARAHYARALMVEPGYEDPLWDLLRVYDATGNYRAFGAVLDRLEMRFGYVFADVEDDFPSFAGSDAYAPWAARRTGEGGGG